jgi:hypothetical protein
MVMTAIQNQETHDDNVHRYQLTVATDDVERTPNLEEIPVIEERQKIEDVIVTQRVTRDEDVKKTEVIAAVVNEIVNRTTTTVATILEIDNIKADIEDVTVVQVQPASDDDHQSTEIPVGDS